MTWVGAGLSLVTAILGGLQTFFKCPKIGEGHRSVASRFLAIAKVVYSGNCGVDPLLCSRNQEFESCGEKLLVRIPQTTITTKVQGMCLLVHPHAPCYVPTIPSSYFGAESGTMRKTACYSHPANVNPAMARGHTCRLPESNRLTTKKGHTGGIVLTLGCGFVKRHLDHFLVT